MWWEYMKATFPADGISCSISCSLMLWEYMIPSLVNGCREWAQSASLQYSIKPGVCDDQYTATLERLQETNNENFKSYMNRKTQGWLRRWGCSGTSLPPPQPPVQPPPAPPAPPPPPLAAWGEALR